MIRLELLAAAAYCEAVGKAETILRSPNYDDLPLPELADLAGNSLKLLDEETISRVWTMTNNRMSFLQGKLSAIYELLSKNPKDEIAQQMYSRMSEKISENVPSSLKEQYLEEKMGQIDAILTEDPDAN